MPEIVKSTINDKNSLDSNLSRKFFLVENISDLKKLKPHITLCIVQTDFNKIGRAHV